MDPVFHIYHIGALCLGGISDLAFGLSICRFREVDAIELIRILIS